MTQAQWSDKYRQQIADMRKQVERVFYYLEAEELNMRPDEKSWSILQCFEHINLSNERYVQNLSAPLEKPHNNDYADKPYKSGWLGQWLIQSISPKGTSIRFKVKTFDFLVPRNVKDPKARLVEHVVFEKFNQDLDAIDQLLQEGKHISWKSNRVPTLIGKWLTLRWGDAVGFALAHTERHIQQAENVLNGRH